MWFSLRVDAASFSKTALYYASWAQAFDRTTRRQGQLSAKDKARASEFLRDSLNDKNHFFVSKITKRLRLEHLDQPHLHLTPDLIQETPLKAIPREPWTIPVVGETAAWSKSWMVSKKDGINVLVNIQPQPTRTNSTSVALLVPFHRGDLIKMDSFFRSWAVTDASNHKTQSQRARCVLAFSGNLSTPEGQRIEIDLQQLFLKFGIVISTHTLSLNQPAIGHYDGAALSFYSLFRILKPHFNAFQLMETDTVPIVHDWIDRLEKAAEYGACVDWWQKGSAQRCNPHLYGSELRQPIMIDYKHDFHINGNALYALRCPAFEDFMRRVQDFYPPRGRWGECNIMGGCETGLNSLFCL